MTTSQDHAEGCNPSPLLLTTPNTGLKQQMIPNGTPAPCLQQPFQDEAREVEGPCVIYCRGCRQILSDTHRLIGYVMEPRMIAVSRKSTPPIIICMRACVCRDLRYGDRRGESKDSLDSGSSGLWMVCKRSHCIVARTCPFSAPSARIKSARLISRQLPDLTAFVPLSPLTNPKSFFTSSFPLPASKF